MTRRKKSRKSGQIGVRKQEVRPTDTKDKRLKKPAKGKKPGARNSLVVDKKDIDNSVTKAKKNPKLGSKKVISLVAEKKAPEPVIAASQEVPQVKLKKVKVPEVAPEKELEQIESDETLIALVERVEDGELLKGKEAKYFNAKMARHAELLEILGIEEEAPSDEFDADQWDDLLDEE